MKCRAVVFALGLALASTTAVQAQQIDACVGHSGKVRILAEGDTCKDAEQVVTWSVSGPQGLPGPQGPPGQAGAPGQGAPFIEDADGRTVGVVTFFSWAHPAVMFTIDGTAVQVSITPDGLLPTGNQNYYFSEPDCMGQRVKPIDPSIAGETFYETGVEVTTEHLTFPTGPIIGNFEYASRTDFVYPVGWVGCRNESGTARVNATKTVSIASLGFRPPFVLRGIPAQ